MTGSATEQQIGTHSGNDPNGIAIARRSKGVKAWEELRRKGGLLPEPPTFPHWEEHFWDGMGEFEECDVVAVLRDAAPNLDNLERRWPWLAHAMFDYKTDIVVGATLDSRADANRLVTSISKNALRLADDLMALDCMLLSSPNVVGAAHSRKAVSVNHAIESILGGPTNVTNLRVGKTALQAKLRMIAAEAEAHNKPVGGDRRRGGIDPHLPKLTLQLALFWHDAKRRWPSASLPSRRDGRDAPFVRLVNGCAQLAGGRPVSRKQVQAILKNIPEKGSD